MKIKIITGFRNEQYYVIDSKEAHKAYYLFNNPEARTTFDSGVALIGKNIQGIEPAYNENMGWNPSHKLDDDDWNEIRGKDVDIKMKNILYEAKQIAYLAEKNPQYLKMTIDEIKQLPENDIKKLT